MLVDPGTYAEQYEALLHIQRTSTEKSVNIYVSTGTADALCAAKIIVGVLQSANIPHSVVPVNDYEDLGNAVQQTLGDAEDQRTAILVGLGADEDVFHLLDLRSRDCIQQVMVIDSHRPIHHANARPSNERVVLFRDPSDGASDVPLVEETDDDEDDVAAGGRRDDKENYASPSGRGNGEDEDDEEERQHPSKRQRVDAAERKQQHYLQGAFHGKPAACVACDFARHIHQDKALHYWWSIVGLTDHLVHQTVLPDVYEQYCDEMVSYIEAEGLNDGDRQQVVDAGDVGAVEINVPLHGEIEPYDEVKLPLLQHWTLWDALRCSPFVGPRMMTYTDKGQEALQLLLIAMGVPLEKARQPWNSVLQPVQDRMFNRLREAGVRFKLGDAWFRSFRWLKGWDKCGLSAADAVHAVNALVETGGHKGSHVESGEAARKRNFLLAMDALGADAQSKLRKGLDAAKALAAAVMQEGGGCVMRREYAMQGQKLAVFDLHNSQPAHKYFQASPASLLKLGMFLQDAFRYMPKGRSVNLVLVGPTDDTLDPPACLVVGIPMHRACAEQGNKLNIAFSDAAEARGLVLTYPAFSSTVVRVESSAVVQFYEEVVRFCIEDMRL